MNSRASSGETRGLSLATGTLGRFAPGVFGRKAGPKGPKEARARDGPEITESRGVKADGRGFRAFGQEKVEKYHRSQKAIEPVSRRDERCEECGGSGSTRIT